MDRPISNITGNPIGLQQGYSFDLVFSLDLFSGGSPLVSNSTHVSTMYCQPRSLTCGTASILTLSFLTQTNFDATVRVTKPFAPFAVDNPNAIAPNSTVRLTFTGGRVNAAYTHFSLGVKYFFFSVSIIMFSVFSWALLKGKGTRDPSTGKWLPTTENQRWTWWLGLGLIFYNDPLYAAGLFSPSIGIAGFYAFCQSSFLVTLLFYWLVNFDRARIVAFRQFSATRNATGCYQRFVQSLSRTAAAMCFWMPKIILLTLLWALTLSVYLFQKYMEISDPAYAVTESFPEYSMYFSQFLAFLMAVYGIWIFTLILIGFCGCPRLALSARFVLGVTVTSIIVVVAAYGANGFFASRSTSLLLMVQFGAVNAYIWFLQIGFLPIYAPLETDINPPASGSGRLEDGDITFTRGSDGVSVETQTEASDFEAAAGGGHVSGGHGYGGTMRSVPLGAGSGAKPIPVGYEAEAGADEFRPAAGISMGDGNGAQNWR